jgi:hypothetical protein
MSDDDRAAARRRYESLLGVLEHHGGRMSARVARRVAGRSGYDHSSEEMRRAEQAAVEQGDILRYSRRGTKHLALTDEETLRKVQRAAGERGDRELVGQVQRRLHEVATGE